MFNQLCTGLLSITSFFPQRCTKGLKFDVPKNKGTIEVKHNNDNVNVAKIPNYNVNDNGRYDRSKKVEYAADKLLERLNMKPESRPFLCKAAWKLTEARLWDNCDQALKGKNPIGLFIWLCKRDGV